MNWGLQEALERHFKKVGVSFRRAEKVPVARIEYTDEASKQIRSDGVNEVTVDMYAEEMADGHLADFPAVVLWEKKDGEHELLDGIHRFLAMQKAKVKDCHAYVVKGATLRQVSLLRRSLNAFNSINDYTTRMRVAQAVQLVNEGWPQREAAEFVRVRPDALNREMRLQSIRAEVATTVRRPLTDNQVAPLLPLRNKHLRLEAVVCIAKANMRGDEVKNFCRKLIDAAERSEAEASKVIAEQMEQNDRVRRPETKAKSTRRLPWQELHTALRSIETRLAEDRRKAVLNSLVDKSEADQLRQVIDAALAALQRFKNEVNRAKRVYTIHQREGSAHRADA